MVRKLSVYLEEGEVKLVRNFVWSFVGILCGFFIFISIFLIIVIEDSFECILVLFKGFLFFKEYYGNLILK